MFGHLFENDFAFEAKWESIDGENKYLGYNSKLAEGALSWSLANRYMFFSELVFFSALFFFYAYACGFSIDSTPGKMVSFFLFLSFFQTPPEEAAVG